MSRIEIIDQNYRLGAHDLMGAPRKLTITNVSLQGLEEMTPTLHFAGHTKRLTLTRDQSSDLIRLTGTPVIQQWIGLTVILEPALTPDGVTIRITTPGAKPRATRLPQPVDEERRAWRFTLIAVAILLAASGVYVALNAAHLAELIAQLAALFN